MDSERKLYVTWHRSMADGCQHAVTDEEFTYRYQRREGEYRAVCGHVVLGGLMSLPPGPVCGACDRYVRACETLRTSHERGGSQQRRGFLGRLVARFKSPAFPRTCPPQDTSFPVRDGRTSAPAGLRLPEPTPEEVRR